jgi:hypothetical protein
LLRLLLAACFLTLSLQVANRKSLSFLLATLFAAPAEEAATDTTVRVAAAERASLAHGRPCLSAGSGEARPRAMSASTSA